MYFYFVVVQHNAYNERRRVSAVGEVVRLRLKRAAGIPAASTYYAAEVYGSCMMSALQGHAWQDEPGKRQTLTERERKAQEFSKES